MEYFLTEDEKKFLDSLQRLREVLRGPLYAPFHKHLQFLQDDVRTRLCRESSMDVIRHLQGRAQTLEELERELFPVDEHTVTGA